MHYFFQFAPRFVNWPLALIPAIRERDPDARFSGLVTDTPQFYKMVQERADCEFEFLDHLDTLERDWCRRTATPELMRSLELRYSPRDLQLTVIADRHVGGGYVRSADLPDSELLLHCRSQQALGGYLLGLYDWLDSRFGGKQRPDLAFLYVVASAPQSAIATACRKYAVNFRTLIPTRAGGGIALTANPRMQNTELLNSFRESARQPDLLADTMGEARTYLENFRSTLPQMEYEESLRQQYLEKLTLAAIARELLLAVVRWSRSRRLRQPVTLRKLPPFQHSWHTATSMWRGRRLLARKDLYVDSASLREGEYLYFPLHVNPEASTMVKTPMLSNQEAMISALARALPPSMKIVVKDHLINVGKRPAAFYEELQRIPNLALVSPFASGALLAKRSAAVATISGTTGLEALQLGRPVFLIGDPEYLHIGEGLVHCSDFAQFPEAMRRTLTLQPASDESLLRYIASELRSSLPLKRAAVWGKVTMQGVKANEAGLAELADRLVAAAGEEMTG